MVNDPNNVTYSTPRNRFFLIAYPRTASNLLIRILSLDNQPNIQSAGRGGGYHFAPVNILTRDLKIWDKHIDQWMPNEKDRIWQCYGDCLKELEKTVRKGEAEGKVVFVKEMILGMIEPTLQAKFVFGDDSMKESPWLLDISGLDSEQTRSSQNPTVLPDEYLKLWKPIFLIRHPALAFPSLYRIFLEREADEDAGGGKGRWISLFMTLHWTRTLYSFYATSHSNESEYTPNSQGITWPIILDADDLIAEPALTRRLAQIIGMDVTRLKFSWMPAGEEEIEKMTPMGRRMLSTILASDSIQKEKSAGTIDLEEEARKWRTEFGASDGQKMEEWVRAAMPDYEFLKERRMRPSN
jgi:hypothetical protein